MDDYRLLVDLHKQGHRQGPGGDAETEQALNLAMIDRTAPLRVAERHKAHFGYGMYVAKKPG